MKAKVLKHKKIPNAYGSFVENHIAYGLLPHVMSEHATMEKLKYLNRRDEELLRDLENYDMIEVEITETTSH